MQCLYNWCPQTHIFKRQMGYVSEDFNGLAYNRDGYDADFSRCLGRTSRDGVYHKDGVRDCTNINSADSISPGFGTPRALLAGNAGNVTPVPNLAGLVVLSVIANGLVTVTATAGGGDDELQFVNSAIAPGDYVSVGLANGTHVYSR